jgi:hypothetical protein
MTTSSGIIVRLALAAAALLPPAVARLAEAQTTQPRLEYVMTWKAVLDRPHVIDKTLFIFNVQPGGWAKGPDISASFIPPGADWLRAMPSGAFRVDVRATLRTEEGELLYVTYGGVIQHTEASLAKRSAGEKFTHEDVGYFVTTPTIQTSSKKYDYLNRVQLIGKFVEARISKEESYVMYDVFIVR